MARRSYRRHRSWGARTLGLLVVGLLAGTVWAGGLLWFAADMPDHVGDTTTRTDAIVVLTGGSGRLEAGLRLLSDDLAGKLFVSGVYRGIDVNKILEISRQRPEDLKCCVEIGHSAGNTTGNAVETAAWMRENGFTSLRLVTSGYHMPRSMLEFRDALPGALLVPNPVFPDHVKQDQWWAWPGTAALVVSEYNKYVLVWLRLSLRHLISGERRR